MFSVSIDSNKAWCTKRDTLTTGSVGMEVELDFSSEWDDLSIFAVFNAYDASESVAVSDDTITIPAAVLTKANVHLLLGFYGVSTGGALVIPTIYCDLGVIKNGADPQLADNFAPADMIVYAQILALAKAAQSAAQTAVSGTYAANVSFALNSSGHLIMSVTEDGTTTTSDLGGVTAYAAALAAGYTGTYDEFKALLIANGATYEGVEQAISDSASALSAATSAASAAATAVSTANSAASTAASAATAAAAVSGKQAQHKKGTATLAANASSWTVSVTGVTASNTVIVTPAPASFSDWVECGVYCSAQGNGTLSFAAAVAPTADLTANIVILD